GSNWRNTASTQAVPQITAASLVITFAWARRSAGINWAVISPAPTSSARALRTLVSISAPKSARVRLVTTNSHKIRHQYKASFIDRAATGNKWQKATGIPDQTPSVLFPDRPPEFAGVSVSYIMSK